MATTGTDHHPPTGHDMALDYGSLEHLLPASWKGSVTAWLAEDTPSFDVGGFVVGDAPRTATLWGKSPGILAGMPFFDEVFAQCGCAVDWLPGVREGMHINVASPRARQDADATAAAVIAAAGGGASAASAGAGAGDGAGAGATSTATPATAHAGETGPIGSGGAGGHRHSRPEEKKIALAIVRGPARGILGGERVALNMLARCSGVASMSRGVLLNLRSAGFRGALAGTRKTTPGFRAVEKYGMLVGGADPHRMDLSSMAMLKDNHVWSRGGSIAAAVKAARAAGGFSLKIEVEVQNEQEADEAIAAGADVVMLDNFGVDEAKRAARSIKQRWAGKRHFLLEISGGLAPDNVEEYLCNDIDIISTSSIHQGVRTVDFSLKINVEKKDDAR